MANEGIAILVLSAVAITGFLIAFNMMHIGSFGLDLTLRWGNMTSLIGVAIARIVGLAMIGVPGWVIYHMIRDR